MELQRLIEEALPILIGSAVGWACNLIRKTWRDLNHAFAKIRYLEEEIKFLKEDRYGQLPNPDLGRHSREIGD